MDFERAAQLFCMIYNDLGDPIPPKLMIIRHELTYEYFEKIRVVKVTWNTLDEGVVWQGIYRLLSSDEWTRCD